MSITKKQNIFSDDFNKNLKHIKGQFSNCCDIEYRYFKISQNLKKDACIIFVNGMVDSIFMTQSVIEPLINCEIEKAYNKEILKNIYESLIGVSNITTEKNVETSIIEILSGNACIIMENESKALIISTVGWQERKVEESQAETVVKGMRAGFIENIRVNGSLLRRMIKSHRLKFEKITIGRLTNTEINIVYIEGIVKDNLLGNVKERINKIDIDGIFTIGTLQELIEDSVFSVFNSTFSTERPDRVCSNLLEGRIAVIMDNSPSVIIAPTNIGMFLQSTEDYNSKYLVASFSRVLRFISINVNLLLPGLYVSVFSFHNEMIPTELLKTVAQAREHLPFPIFVEMIILEFAFEILREAGVRLPRPAGQAVSIVGALVIGQAAVAANLVSPPSIIIVALTAISSFTIPFTEAANPYKILRFPVLIAAGMFGMTGVISVLMMIFLHIAYLKSFGIPYLSPISPFILSDWKDFLVRFPTQFIKLRPNQLAKSNKKRQK
ncbi:spore germination protein [Herbivorax sp. ANBcel31]|uniref:spore germination protein n=1 Tax=Herbivorax sp. ANBcel31 TaxID=3069754 RepID=UPI0027B47C3A|nr:spore germination protein [Herbivorax sp. ANBcel31]MDQ2086765.1 spore germination protein [Herbivorax sp. ANBcel31]